MTMPQLDEGSDASAQQKRSLRTRQLVNYKNNADYVEFEVSDDDEPQEQQPAGKRARLDISVQATSDAQLDVETAWALGFTPTTLTTEEEDLLPPDSDEIVYCRVRNHVLTTWRSDVSRWLSEAEAAAGIWHKHRSYVTAAWRFLHDHGYINFGVAPGIHAAMLATQPTRGTVIIVGAGMAGLAAARQLRASGHQVVVLEGNARAGGRVYTKRLEGDGLAAVADLGGSILTGIDGNPLAVLARQLHIPLHAINSEGVPLYCADGKEANRRLDQQVEQMYNKLLDESDKFRDEMGEITDNVSLQTALEAAWDELPSKTGQREERQLLDWHMANLEFANAQLLRRLSMRSWDQDDPHEVPGQHAFLPGCNIRLVEALAKDVPIFYSHAVTDIDYTEAGVAVHTATQTFTADAVLVTVSLGVLKAGCIKFNPPLPRRKQDAIARMGFGILNKVVMLFPRQFWPKDADMFGRVAETTKERGDFFLFYSYADLAGGPILAALVSGEAAVEFEKQSPQAIVDRVLAVLQRIFKPRGVRVPQPLQAVCTRWGSDPMARGSYSSLCVGSLGGEDYDAMADSVGGRLFFAGEATTKKHPATMHGAFFSGLREAANIKATLAKRAAEAAAQRRRVEAPSTPTPSEAKPHTDQQAARQQANLERAAQLEALLHAAFCDAAHPPDLEFGCFAVVLGPSRSVFEGEALLRIDTGDARGGSRRHLPMFVQLFAHQAAMLRDMRGGDDARIDAMTGPMGVKLVGRAPLPGRTLDFLRAVLISRGTPLPKPLLAAAPTAPAATAPAAMQAAATPLAAAPGAAKPAAAAVTPASIGMASAAAAAAAKPAPIVIRLTVPKSASAAAGGTAMRSALPLPPPPASVQYRAASAAPTAAGEPAKGASAAWPGPQPLAQPAATLPSAAKPVAGAAAAAFSRPALPSSLPAARLPAAGSPAVSLPAALHPDAIAAWLQQLGTSQPGLPPTAPPAYADLAAGNTPAAAGQAALPHEPAATGGPRPQRQTDLPQRQQQVRQPQLPQPRLRQVFKQPHSQMQQGQHGAAAQSAQLHQPQ